MLLTIYTFPSILVWHDCMHITTSFLFSLHSVENKSSFDMRRISSFFPAAVGAALNGVNVTTTPSHSMFQPPQQQQPPLEAAARAHRGRSVFAEVDPSQLGRLQALLLALSAAANAILAWRHILVRAPRTRDVPLPPRAAQPQRPQPTMRAEQMLLPPTQV